MALLLAISLFAYWLIVPTLLSALLPPAWRLGRDGTAVLLALVSWAVLWIWLPLKVWPPRPSPPPFGTILLLGLGALYLGLFLYGLLPRRGESSDTSGEGAALTLALLSPLSEELLFRGFLLTITLRLLGSYGAVAFSSLLFLAAHEVGRLGGARRSLRESLIDLTFGLLAGMLYLMSGTIIAPLALHILVNGLYVYGRRSAAG